MSRCTHILLADDDKDDVELFQSAVKECAPDLMVWTAENGKALLELLDKVPSPDVIILDLNMPYLNGYECLQKIRMNSNYIHIPVMVYSTSTSQTEIDKCLNNGADYYVIKPHSFSALEKLVGDLANGKFSSRLKTFVSPASGAEQIGWHD